ncbi:hypothetical protein [Ekhidna sp. To15]|uniref:hypothetical protein n=1 Tax=Ekhidna sp. To15 TaxID=3395267 RepID=UPI003F525C6F
MKKTTIRLIILAVIVMILLNGVLITLLWTKQSPDKGYQKTQITEVNDFIIRELGFDKETSESFRSIAAQHHNNQIELQKRYRDIKRQLNRAMISQDKEKAELLLEDLTEVVKAKELELFRFFSEVRTITNKQQQREFGRIFREATGAPDYERIPMEDNSNRPPRPRP